ncbi:MAG: TIGR01906 family membrane protein [Chloroflexota bacterium]|jgi:integral membrane protein (TIGR01906 family)|nr:TIGR01906 family membrane protein [Chloroflexota bacterium]
MKNKKIFSQIVRWGAAAMIPFIILMLSVRILITPLFAQAEYRMPGFPEDPYGFSMEDRLRWAEPSISYLVNSADITYLENFEFEDGEPIYNARELSHMQDVKGVVTGVRIALATLMVLFLVLTILADNRGLKNQLLLGCEWGGWIIIGFIVSVLIFLLFSFDVLFTWFHKLFFESGTWKFYTSDTLIRLFPMRFWRDAFIFVGIINLIISTIVIYFSRRQRR